MALQKEQIILWKLGFRVENWKNAEFVLYVPGIRESHPRLEIGDLVHMRQVIEAEQRGSGIALEGRVVTLRKREGFVRELSEPSSHFLILSGIWTNRYIQPYSEMLYADLSSPYHFWFRRWSSCFWP